MSIQFYGIEIGEFPARIAATALWMMDHIMNNRLSLEFGQTYARIPIEKSPHICNADALEIDWADVLPPDECSYVFGNPPFGAWSWFIQGRRCFTRRSTSDSPMITIWRWPASRSTWPTRQEPSAQ